MPNPGDNGWSLEVVRGRDVGKSYALAGEALVLGNALNGETGLDLSEQEGSSPRRMAARQAQLECAPQGLTLRDLDSPGGTFVNRQRLLPGQAKSLQPGDVIQLGGIQMKVVVGDPPKPAPPPPKPVPVAGPPPKPKAPPAPVAGPPPKPKAPPPMPAPPPASPSPKPLKDLPVPFAMASGTTCRSWDDFLTVSAQRWPALRDELTSGRLASFLAKVGAGTMAPSADTPGTPDERLDAWLASLPTTRPSRPELEVHPETLSVRATAGGGMTRQTVQITNVGYRLLRSTVRVEPSAADWIKLPAEYTRGPFVTVERTDLPIEIQIPEIMLNAPLVGAFVIEGNGGTKRVVVRVERPPAVEAIPEGIPVSLGGEGFSDLIVRQSPATRLVLWSLILLALRLLVAIGGMLIAGNEGESSPRLRGAAIVFAAVGGILAAALAARRGEARDVPASGFAGAIAGVFAAALMVAACRTVEPLLGSTLSGSALVPCLLWAAIGAGLAVASSWLIPHQPQKERQP